MDVALLTEGTYPFQHGGVSVWCDQLIRGMPDVRFHVVAVTGGGGAPLRWALPPNVVSVVDLPLWPEDAGRPARKRNRRDPKGDGEARFARAHRAWVAALVRPEADETQVRFTRALRALFEVSDSVDLNEALLTNTALERVVTAWRAANAEAPNSRRASTMYLSDALASMELIEHALRPLAFTPPRVDLYHAVSNGLAAIVGLTGAWRYGAPFLLTEHGVYLRERYLSQLHDGASHATRSLVLAFYRLLTGAIYASADRIRPGSNYNHRWELRNGALSDRIDTVYNGIDPSEFDVAPGEPSVPTIAWLGRIDPIKDVTTLLDAFALVRRAEPNARLRIFGSAPADHAAYLARCHDHAAALGLDGSVTFEGRVAHPRDAYHAGHVVALTSISEGFPYTLIEAMACAKATVSTDVGGVAEAVGDSGLLAPPRDARSIADACLRLLRDPDLRRRLGAAARERVVRRFTVSHCLEAYRDAYAELTRWAA
jgi:glycosyltransferase involved in cell wall biosynthesis